MHISYFDFLKLNVLCMCQRRNENHLGLKRRIVMRKGIGNKWDPDDERIS